MNFNNKKNIFLQYSFLCIFSYFIIFEKYLRQVFSHTDVSGKCLKR
ncbi:hypothetical protein FLBR109950_08065 [Flavobacterium branchiophilum]